MFLSVYLSLVNSMLFLILAMAQNVVWINTSSIMIKPYNIIKLGCSIVFLKETLRWEALKPRKP